MEDSGDVQMEGAADGEECGGGEDGEEQGDGAEVAEGIEAADAVEHAAQDLGKGRGDGDAAKESEKDRPCEPAQDGGNDLGTIGAQGESDGEVFGSLGDGV